VYFAPTFLQCPHLTISDFPHSGQLNIVLPESFVILTLHDVHTFSTIFAIPPKINPVALQCIFKAFGLQAAWALQSRRFGAKYINNEDADLMHEHIRRHEKKGRGQEYNGWPWSLG
jgi:hypothetical protein